MAASIPQSTRMNSATDVAFTGRDRFGVGFAAALGEANVAKVSVSGNTATLKMEGTDGTDYWCASSTDLTGFTTEESTSLGSPFQTTAGVATFTVDVTGDSELFLRVQDADPVP
jgi:hypothetical protein